MSPGTGIVFDNVSKFYGEVLGINRVNLTIPPGITSLVGPNGSGKTTLMNLMTGLLLPTEGDIDVVGISTRDPQQLFRRMGYATQVDAFPRGFSGYRFIYSYLRVHGFDAAEAQSRTEKSLTRVGLVDAAQRKIAGYSKGMRQRVKLAQCLAHDPDVLVLDEPLNGLDPMARAEMIALFKELATEDKHVVISSHILHEVDLISDQVVLLNEGYVVAEGDIRGVRSDIDNHPLQIMIRCDRPGLLAAQAFAHDGVVEAKLHADMQGLMVSTRDADSFYLLLNRIVTEAGLRVEAVTPADEDVHAVYEYLISQEGEPS